MMTIDSRVIANDANGSISENIGTQKIDSQLRGNHSGFFFFLAVGLLTYLQCLLRHSGEVDSGRPIFHSWSCNHDKTFRHYGVY